MQLLCFHTLRKPDLVCEGIDYCGLKYLKFVFLQISSDMRNRKA